MNHSIRVLYHFLGVVKEWSASFILPFYRWLSPPQRACLIMAGAALPIYLIDGQLFILFNAIRSAVDGAAIEVAPFVALLTETLLLLYAVTLVVQYQRSLAVKTIPTRSYEGLLPHPCITVCSVPLHLYHEEIKSNPVEDPDFANAFVGLSAKDQSLIDDFPKALEILKNNAALLNGYVESEEPTETSNEINPSTESLRDILLKNRRPPMATADDLENIIHSTNP